MARGRRGGKFWGRPWLVGAAIALTALAFAAGNADRNAPPRYDGAGYAVLAKALADGRGYRAISHPNAPRHAHFPPGYPLALAALWRTTGESVVAAHWLALACTTTAVVAAWLWLRTMYRPDVAGRLGLALAVNWTWGRLGGSIQSEPLFLLLETLAWLAATRAARRGGSGDGILIGVLLGASVLTRHVAAALVLAVIIHLLWSRRRAAASAALVASLVLVAPWAAWVAIVAEPSQAGLLKGDGLPARVVSQAVFYTQRIPDQLVGPIVEIATVFQHRPRLATIMNLCALCTTTLILFGWARTLRRPRRRLAGLSALVTLALLLIWPFTEAGRFLIPLVPCLLVGMVEGLAALGAKLGVRRPRVVASWLILAVSLPYPVYALATGRAEAQRRTNDGFDAACAWIKDQKDHPGPVLTRHAGEAYWQTRRLAVEPIGDGPEGIPEAVDRWRPAYLLADRERYAKAPPSPIDAYVDVHSDRVRAVWSRDDGRSLIQVYKCLYFDVPSKRSRP